MKHKTPTIHQAIMSLVPEGITYNALLRHAINAVNMASVADASPAKAHEYLKITLIQNGVQEISGALISLLLIHAAMAIDSIMAQSDIELIYDGPEPDSEPPSETE